MEDSIAIYFPVNYVKFPKEDILPNNFDLMLLNSPLQSKKFCKCEFTVFFFYFLGFQTKHLSKWYFWYSRISSCKKVF